MTLLISFLIGVISVHPWQNPPIEKPRIVVYKSARKLELYSDKTLVRTFPAFANTQILLRALGGGKWGTQAAYDLSTPEGMLASLNDKIADYEQKMAAFDEAAQAFGNGIPYDQLPPEFQRVVDQQLAPRNIGKPSRPAILGAYAAWVAMQPREADTSPAAYVRWYFAYKGKGGTPPSGATEVNEAITSGFVPQTNVDASRYATRG